MDIVPNNIPQKDVVEEVNFRTSRAGYTTRSGGPISPRIVSMPYSKQGRKNYDRIFKR